MADMWSKGAESRLSGVKEEEDEDEDEDEDKDEEDEAEDRRPVRVSQNDDIVVVRGVVMEWETGECFGVVGCLNYSFSSSQVEKARKIVALVVIILALISRYPG